LSLQPGCEYSRKAAGECRRQIALEEAEDSKISKKNDDFSDPRERTGAKKWIIAVSVVLVLGLLMFLVLRKGSDPDAERKPPLVQRPVNSADSSKESVTKTQPETRAGAVVKAILNNMVAINGGGFTMGSNATKFERPAHRMFVGPFRLSKYEVTREQWNVITKSNRYAAPLNSPATNVSWDEVQGFIATLNKISGQRFRLPSEAEWEYACMHGPPGGYEQVLNEYSWNMTNAGDSVHPVGQKLPNSFGLYDMLGNAYEWCSDSQGAYKSNEKDETRKILRGGDFKSKLRLVSPKARNWNIRSKSTDRIGFRLAMDPGERTGN
jgi:formylglycine-generating enzyme required for sulfatase activity